MWTTSAAVSLLTNNELTCISESEATVLEYNSGKSESCT